MKVSLRTRALALALVAAVAVHLPSTALALRQPSTSLSPQNQLSSTSDSLSPSTSDTSHSPEHAQVLLPSSQETQLIAARTRHLARQRSDSFLRDWALRVETAVDILGDAILGLFGLSVEDSGVDADGLGDDGGAGNGGAGGIVGWAESSVFVVSTNALHPSRPSSFGPHLSEPLTSLLYPIQHFLPGNDPKACPLPSLSASASTPPTTLAPRDPAPLPPSQWIALIERGGCPFSAKVRTAMELGAEGVVFGDLSADEGGLGGIGGLLTPWSPDDTSDITIPSSFVSRASYMSLIKTWQDQQHEAGKHQPASGLVVIMSKDEVFAWPLLDLLLLILFLPSLLTLLTVFTQRIRQLRQQKLDRAPKDVVDRLPILIWAGEKGLGDALVEGTVGVDRVERGENEAPGRVEDEESAVGVSRSDGQHADESDNEAATESTSLLPRPSAPSILSRILPARFLRSFSRRQGGKTHVLAAPHQRSPLTGLTECAICISEFVKGEEVLLLPCGHLFHKDEIVSWLVGVKRICPTCRASITTDGDAAPPSPGDASLVPSPAAPVAIAADAGREEEYQPVAGSSTSTIV